MYVYPDQPADSNEFGVGSIVMTRFSKRKDMLMEGRVYSYMKGYNWRTRKFVTYILSVRTEYSMFGKNQLKQSFHPSKVRLKGAHNACRYFKTDCMANERCVPRRLSGHICPGEYKCVCKTKGWKAVRGRGCVDVDECEKSPCGALFVCVNTIGSYKCECQAGYTGSKCDEEIDECKQSLCPKNSVCKNVPGSFQCTCLPGFTGKDCSKSETEDSETTAPTIKDYTKKKIAIPRKRPVKTIRKPVFLYEARHTERAVMIAAIAVLNSLGIFLYCCQKRKRAKKQTIEKGTIPSTNQELEKEETIQGNQVSEKTEVTIQNGEELALTETTLTNDLQLMNTEIISDNEKLKMSSETNPGRQEVEDNEAIENVQELQNSETIPGDQKLDEVFPNDQDLKLTETVPNGQNLEKKEAIPSTQVLKYSKSVSSNQELQDGETVLGNQVMLENTQTITNHQDLESNEAISSNQEFENIEAVLVNDVLDDGEVFSRNQSLINTETPTGERQAMQEVEMPVTEN